MRASATCYPLSAVLFLAISREASAARIGDVAETDIWSQAFRFWSFQDELVVFAVLGCALLGVTCGLLGSFMVVRKMALFGDAMSHAVFPGVVLGYLSTMSKNPLALFVGAVVAAFLGAAVVRLIRQTTRLKNDAALAIVLGGFFAVGACLLGMVQRLPTASKSGLDSFLFGQASAINIDDFLLIAGVAVGVIVVVVVFYRPFFAVSFDPEFAKASGVPVLAYHYLLMLLIAFAVVVALQAVGIVLVSAMLIIPAASAYLLTDRFPSMLVVASVLGAASAVLGAFFSFLGTKLPTGPFMVLAAGCFFGVAFLFSPRHGVLRRWWQRRHQRARVRRENTLKAIFHHFESTTAEAVATPDSGVRVDPGDRRVITVDELAGGRRLSQAEVRREFAALVRHGFAAVAPGPPGGYSLTEPGARRALEIVRNHRLWELYLTNEVSIAADHVHDDAEEIEHVLGEETVRELEAMLDYSDGDPHGKEIPLVPPA